MNAHSLYTLSESLIAQMLLNAFWISAALLPLVSGIYRRVNRIPKNVKPAKPNSLTSDAINTGTNCAITKFAPQLTCA